MRYWLCRTSRLPRQAYLHSPQNPRYLVSMLTGRVACLVRRGRVKPRIRSRRVHPPTSLLAVCGVDG
jgi:hypothetical protein